MRQRRFDPAALDDALREREFVLTHADLLALGLSLSSVTRRIGPHGPWQRLLPGVVLAHRGTPTRRQLVRASLAFAGKDAVVTGVDALSAHGVRSLTRPAVVEVLVPQQRQRRSMRFVAVERTRRLPDAIRRNGLPVAPASRALVDACRRTEEAGVVRELVAASVQQRVVALPDFADEVQRAARPRTALSRLVLREVSDGVRSVAEAAAREVMRDGGIPAPLWNVQLMDEAGSRILSPDCYWPELGLAVEIDSYAWHLSPKDYLRTLRRSRRMVVNGVIVLHFAPVEIRDDPAGFLREVRAMQRLLEGRGAPRGVVVAPGS